MEQEKKQLREKLIQIRMALSPQEQALHAQSVAQLVQNMAIFQSAKHIAFYFPVKGELSPLPLLSLALAANKNCYLPVLTSQKSLRFFSVDAKTSLSPNRYGIYEPALAFSTERNPHDLDIVFLPLVGFDEKCYRLGMGGAYYDRTFAFRHHESSPLLVGLAHECQNIKAVPQNDFDVKLDKVVSEKKIYSKE